jgi:hypothetical protein
VVRQAHAVRSADPGVRGPSDPTNQNYCSRLQVQSSLKVGEAMILAAVRIGSAAGALARSTTHASWSSRP